MCNHKVPCTGPNGQVVYRPCGKCLDCLRQYQQDWTCRLSEEFKAWSPGSVIFFTLTYAESELPVMVTYNHPVNLQSYQCLIRNRSVPKLQNRLQRLGLGSFYYTRPLKQTNREFIQQRKAIQDSFLDIPEFEKPALFVPSSCYEDINNWIRYCRKYFDRHVASVPFRDKRVSPYLMDLEFRNIHGVNSLYPDSAYTPSFKYWLTTEYGPTTLRPHVHGVLFGVPEEMFRDVFAPWWRSRFGENELASVDYSVYEPDKGGALYISKYCSKGSFEHPLCSRSIHYPSGKEFVSNSFINCLNWFGVDNPLCVPSFRLISKGIGVRYPFNAEIQRYWEIKCDEFTKFVTKDQGNKVFPLRFLSDIDLGSLTSLQKDSPDSMPGVVNAFGTFYTLSRISDRHRNKVIQQSDFVIDPSLDSTDDYIQFQDRILNKKYIRAYVYKGQTKSFSSLLPRYYRRFLLSPCTQVALSSALQRCSDDDFNRKRKFVKSFRSQDGQAAAVEQIAFGENFKRKHTEKALADKFNKFYCRTFAGDLVYEN